MFTLITQEDPLHSWLTLTMRMAKLSLSGKDNTMFQLGQLASYLTARMWFSTLQSFDVNESHTASGNHPVLNVHSKVHAVQAFLNNQLIEIKIKKLIPVDVESRIARVLLIPLFSSLPVLPSSDSRPRPLRPRPRAPLPLRQIYVTKHSPKAKFSGSNCLPTTGSDLQKWASAENFQPTSKLSGPLSEQGLANTEKPTGKMSSVIVAKSYSSRLSVGDSDRTILIRSDQYNSDNL